MIRCNGCMRAYPEGEMALGECDTRWCPDCVRDARPELFIARRGQAPASAAGADLPDARPIAATFSGDGHAAMAAAAMLAFRTGRPVVANRCEPIAGTPFGGDPLKPPEHFAAQAKALYESDSIAQAVMAERRRDWVTSDSDPLTDLQAYAERSRAESCAPLQPDTITDKQADTARRLRLALLTGQGGAVLRMLEQRAHWSPEPLVSMRAYRRDQLRQSAATVGLLALTCLVAIACAWWFQ